MVLIALETTIIDMRTIMAIELPGAKNHTKIKRSTPADNLMYVLTGCFTFFKRKWGRVKTTITARINKISFSVIVKKIS